MSIQFKQNDIIKPTLYFLTCLPFPNFKKNISSLDGALCMHVSVFVHVCMCASACMRV